MPFATFYGTKATKLALLAIGIYVVVYAVLSAFGRYQNNIESLDRLGIITRGWPDRQEWQPILITLTRFPGTASAARGNLLGYLFIPLVVLDQHFCHPTQEMASTTETTF